MDIHFTSRDRSGLSEVDIGPDSDTIAMPLHLQRLERALRVDLLMRQVESFVSSDGDEKQIEMLLPLNKQQLRTLKTKTYDLSKVKKSKKWIKNVLIEKSSDSDLTDDEDDHNGNDLVKELVRFQNFKKKVRNEFVDNSVTPGSQSPALKPFECYSTSLLSSSLSQSFADPPENTVPIAKPASESKSKRSRPTKVSAKRKTPIAGSETPACPTPPVIALSSSPAPVQRSETGSITDSVSISTISTPPLPASLPASLTLSVTDSVDSIKKFKLDKMMDQIPYDMTLPDEILQSESSDPSPSTALTDEIMYSSQLPDEIFDTEESSNSLLSQALSSPPSSVLAAGILTGSSHKAATAPPTPTGLSGSGSQSKSGPKNSVKWKAMRRSNHPQSSLTATSLSAPVSQNSMHNPELQINSKRKKVWATIVKCIPKTQEQVLSERQTGLNNCKKISGWCREEHGRILQRWSSLVAVDPENLLRKEMLSFWQIPFPVVEQETAITLEDHKRLQDEEFFSGDAVSTPGQETIEESVASDVLPDDNHAH